MIFFENIRLISAETKHLPYLVRWLNNLPPTRINVAKKMTCIAEQEERLNSLEKKIDALIANLN